MPVEVRAAAFGTVQLRAEMPAKASEATALVLTGTGHQTEEEARRHGEAAKHALRRAGVVANVPLDMGPDRASGSLGRGFREQLENEHGVQLRDDIHGLDVYEDDSRPVRFLSSRASPIVTASVDKFVPALEAGFQRGTRRDAVRNEKVSLAADVYMLSEFEVSQRARFLTLMTALEVLSERGERPKPVQKLLVEFLAKSREAAAGAPAQRNRSEFESLIGSLEGLREQSITSAVRDFVRRHIGDAEKFDGHRVGEFVTRSYEVRSRLTHEGRPPDGVDIARLGGELRRLVQAVVVAEFDAP